MYLSQSQKIFSRLSFSTAPRPASWCFRFEHRSREITCYLPALLSPLAQAARVLPGSDRLPPTVYSLFRTTGTSSLAAKNSPLRSFTFTRPSRRLQAQEASWPPDIGQSYTRRKEFLWSTSRSFCYWICPLSFRSLLMSVHRSGCITK